MRQQTNEEPDILYLQSKKYQKRSIAGDLLDSNAAKIDLAAYLARDNFLWWNYITNIHLTQQNFYFVALATWQKVVGKIYRQLSKSPPRCRSKGQQNNGFVSFGSAYPLSGWASFMVH